MQEKLTAKKIEKNGAIPFIDTRVKADALLLNKLEKIDKIKSHFREIKETLCLDLKDDSLKDTPEREAKMHGTELFRGLDPLNEPEITLFDNKYKYDQMLVEKWISFYSNCEHHFVPIYGRAHMVYNSSGNVIELSKLNRIVNYSAKRPQIQERLTVLITKSWQKLLQTEDVAGWLDAKLFYVALRGIKDTGSITITSFYGGKFKNSETNKAFFNYLQHNTEY